MPQLIDTGSRAGTLAAAVNELLVTEGIPGLSLRRIASVSRVSTGSIIHHLGSKDRLLSQHLRRLGVSVMPGEAGP